MKIFWKIYSSEKTNDPVQGTLNLKLSLFPWYLPFWYWSIRYTHMTSNTAMRIYKCKKADEKNSFHYKSSSLILTRMHNPSTLDEANKVHVGRWETVRKDIYLIPESIAAIYNPFINLWWLYFLKGKHKLLVEKHGF